MTIEERLSYIESEISALSVNALVDEPAPSYYTSRYSGEQIDNLLSGLGFEISGSYANLAAIQAAFPNGDTHAYQAQDTGNIYVWNAKTSSWESVGKLQGPVGPKGETGDTGPQGPPGEDGETIAYNFGHGLNQNGLDITVNAVSDFSGDNTLPMTAAGVQTQVGNIEALLAAI